jgi:hypothetical protein
MAGWYRGPKEHAVEYPANPMIQKALAQIFPARHLSILSSNEDEMNFITAIKSSFEEPLMLWNGSARQELLEFVTAQTNQIVSTKKFDPSAMMSFVYKTHAQELVAAGIFVRFYNQEIRAKQQQVLKPAAGKPASTFKLETPAVFMEKLCLLLRDEYKAFCSSADISRVVSVLEAMYNVVTAHKETSSSSITLSDIFPTMIALIRAGKQYEPAVLYLLEILYEFLNNGGNAVAAALVKANVVECMRDLLYSQLDVSLYTNKITNDSVQDLIRENAVSVLYKVFTSDNPGVLARALRLGLFIYVFEMFCGCYNNREILRKKAAFVLSALLQEQETDAAMRKYIPSILADVIKCNPSLSLATFDKLHEYPELIWNGDMRNLLKLKVSEQVLQYFQAWQQNSSVEWILPSNFYVEYTYPNQIAGIYVGMYTQHANYPIENYDKLIAGLVDFLLQNYGKYVAMTTH